MHCWKYLKSTIDFKLTLSPSSDDHQVQLFTDATWANDLDTRTSQSGIIAFWKNCPISWTSNKQRNITLSSTESELNALSDGIQENLWLTHLISELWNVKLLPSLFHINNKGLLEKIQHFGSNSKTKHIDIKIKYIQKLFKENEIKINLIPSANMTADALTKAANSQLLHCLISQCFSKADSSSSNDQGC